MSGPDAPMLDSHMLPAGDAPLQAPWPRASGGGAQSQIKLCGEDIPYLKDLNEALLAQSTPASTAMLYLITVIIVAALIWASLARVEEVTKADARVIPAGREQVISSLEGGILAEMFVREGAIVKKDQPLLRLDATRFRSQYREGLSRTLALKGSIARLRAEAAGASPSFPPDVAASPQVVRDEMASFEARRRSLQESQDGLRRSLEMLDNEIASAERLSNKGLYSAVELSRLKRQANELQSQIDERQNKFRADVNSELLRLESDLGQVKENLEARLDTFKRTTIKAPIRGVVKNIRAATLGGTVQAGAPILEIIPLDDDLLLEARLKPADVAFVHAGLPAKVKLTAYDYSVFGDLKGVVQLVSPDTIKDETRASQPDSSFYRVIVKTQAPAIRVGDRDLPIIPGMIGQVEIRTGEKTVLDYLLKPMFKAREALRER
jgi:membrane fusion protein, adhesin transport system